MRVPALTLALLLPVSACLAGGVNRVEVTHDAGRYAVVMDVDVEADRDRVRAITLDADGLHRLSTAIVESRRLPPLATDPDRRRLVYRSCFLIHCFTKVLVESVRTEGPGRVITTVEPALSDFRAGHATWDISEVGPGRTRVHLEAVLEPRFWVPPVIGPWIIAAKMRGAAEETGLKLEELARE